MYVCMHIRLFRIYSLLNIGILVYTAKFDSNVLRVVVKRIKNSND